MKYHYLSVLGLKEGATEKEIKKRYRQLVKKYHPDVNGAADAATRFIEIDVAYEYLTRKVSTDEARFDFNDVEKLERQERIRRSREKAWKKRQEELRQQKKVLHKFSYAVGVVVLINLTFLLDMMLPVSAQQEEIKRIENVRIYFNEKELDFDYQVLKGGYEPYFKIVMERHVLKISEKSPFPKSRRVLLSRSQIYGIPYSITYDGLTVPVYFSLYRVFDKVIYIILIVAGLFFGLKSNIELRFGMIAVIIVMLLMQLVVILN